MIPHRPNNVRTTRTTPPHRPPSPHCSQSSCIPPPGKECPWQPQCPPQAGTAAQVGVLCPAGPITGPPGRRSHPSSVPIRAACHSCCPKGPTALKGSVWKLGSQSTGALLCSAWGLVQGVQGCPMVPHQHLKCSEVWGLARELSVRTSRSSHAGPGCLAVASGGMGCPLERNSVVFRVPGPLH